MSQIAWIVLAVLVVFLIIVLVVVLAVRGIISKRRRRERQIEDNQRQARDRFLAMLASHDPSDWKPIPSGSAVSPNYETFELPTTLRDGHGSVYRLEQGGRLSHCLRYPELGPDRWQDLPDYDDEPRLDAIYARLIAFYDPKLFGETS